MAPPKRKSGGRTTPKGTQPGHAPAASPAGQASSSSPVSASSRYTPPVPRAATESPRWVPILMLTLLAIGALLILGRYLAFSDSNWPLFAGLAFMMAGLYTATRWR